MKKEWITDFNEMPFTVEEYHIAEAVTWFTDSILYFNGKDYKMEDPSDTYYFTSKDLLMEDMNYTYNELEKQGVFDLAFTDEEEAPADPWLKVLEDRVEMESKKEATHKKALEEYVEYFKEWVNSESTAEIVGGIEWKASQIAEAYKCYKEVWHRLGVAKDELAAYKRTMKL